MARDACLSLEDVKHAIVGIDAVPVAGVVIEGLDWAYPGKRKHPLLILNMSNGQTFGLLLREYSGKEGEQE
jgi:hypothetical protein